MVFTMVFEPCRKQWFSKLANMAKPLGPFVNFGRVDFSFFAYVFQSFSSASSSFFFPFPCLLKSVQNAQTVRHFLSLGRIGAPRPPT